MIGILDLVQWFSFEHIFCRTENTCVIDWTMGHDPLAHEIIEMMILDLISYRTIRWPFLYERNIDCFSVLEDLEKVLLLASLPWIRIEKIRLERATVGSLSFPLTSWLLQRAKPYGKKSDSHSCEDIKGLFGAFGLSAALLEMDECLARKTAESIFSQMLDRIRTAQHPFFNFLRWTLLARFESVAPDKVQAELDKCKFTAEQQDFAWRWIRKEIDLVRVEHAENEPIAEEI